MDGGLTEQVTTNDNETYPTSTSAPKWSATWQYEAGPETQPVHAFPNIMVDDGLPITLGNVSAIDFDLFWTYSVGDVATTSTDTSDFNSVSLNTNVAIDMFMDSDATTASNSSAAKYEIMVWFAHFGDAAQVIGNSTGVVDTVNLNGTTLYGFAVLFPFFFFSRCSQLTDIYSDLYYGTNSESQNVFSWVTQDTTERFTGDLSQLITELTSKSGSEYPSTSDYLGSFAFGSEAYYATQNVTFYVPELSVDIQSKT